MAYSSLPTLVPGDPIRASYVQNLDENLDDHEARLVDEEAATADHEVRIVTLEGEVSTGDVVGPVASVASEFALFDGTTGKLLKRATGTGPVKATSGVYGTGAIDLSGSEVTGNLGVAHLNAGTLASSSTFWRGDATWATPAGAGDVVGPGSATDNAIARFDSTTGKLIQNSGITVADGVSGTLSGTNSGDVTLAGTPNYLTIAAQVITRALIDLASHITGRLPYANLTAAAAASKLLGRESGSAGDWEEITLGTNLSMSGSTLNATGGGGSGTVTNTGTLTDNALIVGTGGVDVEALASLGTTTTLLHGNAAGLPTFGAVDLSADVTGNLGVSHLNSGTSASGSTFWRGDGSWATPSATTIPKRTIGLTVDGAGAVITAGIKGYISVPYACTITGWTLLSTDAATIAGSITFSLYKDAYASYPSTTSLTGGGTKPSLSTADHSVSSSLASWTTAITAGDIIGFEVDATPALVTRVTLFLEVQP